MTPDSDSEAVEMMAQAIADEPRNNPVICATAALAALREAGFYVGRWMPIESAPKDGTPVSVGNGDGTWAAKYEPVYQSGYRPENPWFSLFLNHRHIGQYPSLVPTHWMPLPEPPRAPAATITHHGDPPPAGVWHVEAAGQERLAATRDGAERVAEGLAVVATRRASGTNA